MSAANLSISNLWERPDTVSKCIVGLFWGRQRVFYWLSWGCAGNWINVRAKNQSHNATHDNTSPFSKRPMTGLAWLLIYHNTFLCFVKSVVFGQPVRIRHKNFILNKNKRKIIDQGLTLYHYWQIDSLQTIFKSKYPTLNSGCFSASSKAWK